MLWRLLYHWLTLMLALWLVVHVRLLGISYDTMRDLAIATLLLVLVHTFVKPLIILFTLPLVLLSLGLFVLFINAILLYWIPDFVPGFHVPSFTSAFFGAILVSLISGFFGRWEKRSRRSAPSARQQGRVIDI